MSFTATIRAVGAGLAFAGLAWPVHAPAQAAQRVYVVVADSVPMTVQAAATAVAAALTKTGWSVRADHPVGTDTARCTYAARIIVATQPAHAATLLAHGTHAAFAVPVRIGVFEDEKGVHVSMVNPLSVERTIATESGLEASGRAIVTDVAATVASAVRGRRVNRPYGQSRERGLIGKTMGVMAGGPFTGQLETITASTGTPADVRRIADQVWQRLQQPRGKWQLHGVYRMDLEEDGIVILGVSGAAMEQKAFAIVGAGDDDSRSSLACPGIAYAAAFPVELVIRHDAGQVRVEMINAMFRMKMYFEDAGRMKFARNMGMPGSIAEELKGIVAPKAVGP